MYSDTHFHFPLIQERIAEFNSSEFLISLVNNKCFFAQDIGTECDDLQKRISYFNNALSPLDENQQIAVKKFMRFSAGIWPSIDAIKYRVEQVAVLEEEIKKSSVEISAIGECGLDHYWNPSGEDGRSESDFDKEMFTGEKELFIMQLCLAKKLNKPVVVHSRNAFTDTVDCIKKAGYDKGVIHCYSYGKEEAKIFLDMGWYISFCGNVTYAKKAKLEDMIELLRYIPKERLLLETDSPYLAPVPFRGQPNTPLLIENTYKFIAEKLNFNIEDLCASVDNNSASLFL